jgi:metallo-beta-lactamase family protein
VLAGAARRRSSPAEPLFTTADAEAALRQLQVIDFDQKIDVAPGLQAEFIHAGHLLGSAFIRVSRKGGGARILFGGDLEETRNRGGRVIIPSFAIGRAEELLYWIKRVERKRLIQPLPVYLDSPMAVEALRFYVEHERELDRDVQAGDGTASAFTTKWFRPVSAARDSMEVTRSTHPAIVISASGMATGGRVLHHLEACLPDARHTILFVGFQAEGTRGRTLTDGASAVKIHGSMIPVAARVTRIDTMSAHADQTEIVRWLRTFRRKPDHTFLVHGEPAAQDALKEHIETTLKWRVHVPQHGERVEVSL